ncbi:Zinc finger BED domain-containing hypothetical protein [Phytophthora megakarya]|uniref:Uncharacterized protein n=1 Tax=Phytophthora megakarya TaxID=4795 RepID=A0A225WQW1_9STRA|nr:Zinc finger BED domain-containing hypothetical protein [Phytophthora megakarya]
MALTIHYLTKDFDSRVWALEVEHFPGKHSGIAISAETTKAMERWGLDKNRCSMLLRDSAANVTLAGDITGVRHMSCLAHTMHLVVAGSLQVKKERKKRASESDTIRREANGST